ncbi:hypothetical protein [Hydrogenophaga sp. PML113]|uniref:hypothetical protein n=1 Tax=Hydrogenophaga sp. PML113 TaxID=1899350 RepID=UPI001586D136|nr:hypothetical protein [Hydrogenophaga sp. PML113]
MAPTLPPGLGHGSLQVLVLVLCPRGQALQDVREQVARWAVPGQVRWTSDPVEALRLALAQPPALAIVDARLDRAGGRALVGQLARWRSDLEVFIFDDPPAEGLRGQGSLWHWCELPRVLRWWASRHLPSQAVPDSLPVPLARAA